MSVGPVVAYVVGVRSIRAAVSIAIAAGVLVVVFGARSPRRALQAARRLAAGAERAPRRAET